MAWVVSRRRPLPPAVITGGSSVRPGSPPRSPKGHMSPKSGHMTARNVDEEEYGERSGYLVCHAHGHRRIVSCEGGPMPVRAMRPSALVGAARHHPHLRSRRRCPHSDRRHTEPTPRQQQLWCLGVSPAMSIATGSGPHIGTSPYEDIVPGGLSVLGRGHALHAAQAGNGHLEPACVLSPRSQPGGVSVKLGGKPKKAPAHSRR